MQYIASELGLQYDIQADRKRIDQIDCKYLVVEFAMV
jgi:hypothetical protein